MESEFTLLIIGSILSNNVKMMAGKREYIGFRHQKKGVSDVKSWLSLPWRWAKKWLEALILGYRRYQSQKVD